MSHMVTDPMVTVSLYDISFSQGGIDYKALEGDPQLSITIVKNKQANNAS